MHSTEGSWVPSGGWGGLQGAQWGRGGLLGAQWGRGGPLGGKWGGGLHGQLVGVGGCSSQDSEVQQLCPHRS